MFRKATVDDIDRITEIYDEIHTEEEAGRVTIGWVRGVYPTRATAEAAVAAGDMYVEIAEDAAGYGLNETGSDVGTIVAAARINKEQVAEYADAVWNYDAPAGEVMVLHTLVVSPSIKRKGYGTRFVAFYEDFALQNGCRYLRMDTNARNVAARALYKKLGYTEVGIVPSVFNGIEGVQLVCLEKTL